jgi:hypothetical protein
MKDTEQMSIAEFERWLAGLRKVRHVPPAPPEHDMLARGDLELRRLIREEELRRPRPRRMRPSPDAVGRAELQPADGEMQSAP